MTLDDNIQDRETLVKEVTELGQVMDNLDAQENIDQNSNLTKRQIDGMIQAEELIQQGILDFVNITDKAKKLNVSLKGRGREDKVRIVAGQREHQTTGGVGGFFKNLFIPRQ